MEWPKKKKIVKILILGVFIYFEDKNAKFTENFLKNVLHYILFFIFTFLYVSKNVYMLLSKQISIIE